MVVIIINALSDFEKIRIKMEKKTKCNSTFYSEVPHINPKNVL